MRALSNDVLNSHAGADRSSASCGLDEQSLSDIDLVFAAGCVLSGLEFGVDHAFGSFSSQVSESDLLRLNLAVSGLVGDNANLLDIRR